MLVYEKIDSADNKRHLFGTLGTAPSDSDARLVYADPDGGKVEDLSPNETFLDNGRGGIIRKSDNKELYAYIDGENIIPGHGKPAPPAPTRSMSTNSTSSGTRGRKSSKPKVVEPEPDPVVEEPAPIEEEPNISSEDELKAALEENNDDK